MNGFLDVYLPISVFRFYYEQLVAMGYWDEIETIQMSDRTIEFRLMMTFDDYFKLDQLKPP